MGRDWQKNLGRKVGKTKRDTNHGHEEKELQHYLLKRWTKWERNHPDTGDHLKRDQVQKRPRNYKTRQEKKRKAQYTTESVYRRKNIAGTELTLVLFPIKRNQLKKTWIPSVTGGKEKGKGRTKSGVTILLCNS